MTGPGRLAVHALTFVLALLHALPAVPSTGSEAALDALRAVSRRYGALVREIDPDHIPGSMEGYAEATEMLERLGNRLEGLSRLAVSIDAKGGDWGQVLEGVTLLDGDITALKASSAPLRVYSFSIRSGIKHPRWAIAQVRAAEFVAPPARAFTGSFTRTVKVEGQPGQEVYFQLVAVPALKKVPGVSVKLPGRLRGPAGDIGGLEIEDFFAISRSTPLDEDERDFPLCPYRLRPAWKGADIPGDQVLPCWFRMVIPAAAQPGTYSGSMKFEGHKVPAIPITLQLTVVGLEQ